MEYIRDPAEIYQRSFAIVEREAGLANTDPGFRAVVTRMIHACGMVDLVDELRASPGAVEAGKAALEDGCAIFCDVEMVKSGIIDRFLPGGNSVICTLGDERVPALARAGENTRSAAAVDLWDHRLGGSVVVIGNAPTALFRLLERLDADAPKPALIIGIPVGFVGAEESKLALLEDPRGCEYITVLGRRGGSAIASACLNGIAGGTRHA